MLPEYFLHLFFNFLFLLAGEWFSLVLNAPLIGYLQKFATEGDPFKRGLIIADACEWLASKTTNRIDDEAVRHIAAVLKTPEGEALVRWVLLQIEAAR